MGLCEQRDVSNPCDVIKCENKTAKNFKGIKIDFDLFFGLKPLLANFNKRNKSNLCIILFFKLISHLTLLLHKYNSDCINQFK